MTIRIRQMMRDKTIWLYAYALLITLLFMMPANWISLKLFTGADKLFHFLVYAAFSYLLLLALGSCPLRWRKLAPWVFVIVFAHAYWMEFLQAYIPGLHRHFSVYDLLAGAIGGLSGIFYRLKRAYQRCNCSLMAGTNITSQDAGDAGPGSSNKGLLTIADHPGLNSIIAGSFGWKALTLHPCLGMKVQMVCTGRSLISLPHFSYGSVCLPESNVPVDWPLVMQQYALPRNISRIELRLPDLAQNGHSKVASWLFLEPDMKLQMNVFSNNLRRKIRKASENNFDVVEEGRAGISSFWKIYARHMHKLGSVALPLRFFAKLYDGYQYGKPRVFLMYRQGKLVGGAFCLSYNGFYENLWFATLHPVQPLYASYILHQKMIADAIALGDKIYSFGRSTTNSGVHRFKKQWGSTDISLNWVVFPAQQLSIRKMSWLLEVWKRLPYPLARFAGSLIAKWVH